MAGWPWESLTKSILNKKSDRLRPDLFAPPLGLEPDRAFKYILWMYLAKGPDGGLALGEPCKKYFKQKIRSFKTGFVCSSSWARTKDPLINSQML